MAQRLATTDEVILAYPGAADLDAPVVAYWLDVAATQFDLALWGEKASHGHALLTAHYLVLQAMAAAEGGGGGMVGAVTKRTFGDISEEYGEPASSGSASGEFSSTSYGLLFEALRSTVVSFSAVAGGQTWAPFYGWSGWVGR